MLSLNTAKTCQCTICFKSLGVESRMSLYTYLSSVGEQSVSQLVKHVGLTQPTVSHHLKDMRDSGLITSTKRGKEVYYSVSSLCPTYAKPCVLKNVNLQIEN